jgi:hypothetical protein
MSTRYNDLVDEWQSLSPDLSTAESPRLNTKIGLGLGFRLRLVFIVSELPAKQLAPQAALDEATFNRAVSRGDGDRAARTKAAKPLADFAYRLWESTLQSNGITRQRFVEHFTTGTFNGPNAPRDFVLFLQKGWHQIKNVDTFLKDVINIPFVRNSREPELERIEAFLKRQDLKPILVVHQKSMDFGLTALAVELCTRMIPADKKLQLRPYCYIPVARNPGRPVRMKLHDIVGALDAFYSGREVDPNDIPESPNQLRRAAQRIRESMAYRPAILIFDGCRDVGPELSNLNAYVADDPLREVLSLILSPFLAPSTIDPNVFYETRAIVLADGELRGLDPMLANPLPLPRPPDTDMKALATAQIGAQAHKAIAALGHWDQFTNEAVLFLADALISTGDFDKNGAFDAEYFLEHNNPLTPTRLMSSLATSLVKKGPSIDLCVLRLAALSHSGIRLATLVRILNQLTDIWPDGRAVGGLTGPIPVSKVASSIEALRGVLIETDGEFIPSLDSEPHPFEFLDAPLNYELSDESFKKRIRTFEVKNAEIRTAIERQLVNGDPQSAAVLHRLLSEECIRQHTIMQRYRTHDDGPDHRVMRRLVQALYHGFKSISYDRDSGVAFEHILTAVSADPVAAFRRLFATYYLTHMEAPPHLEFSRVFGGDRIKTDLLLTALRLGGERTDYRAIEFCNDNELTHELLVALALSSFHANDLPTTNSVIDAGRRVLEKREKKSVTDQLKTLRSLIKIQIDTSILEDTLDQYQQAFEKCGEALDSAELFSRTAVSSVADRFISSAEGKPLGEFVERELIALERRIASDCPAWRLGTWSDLLCRWAEIIATRAEARDHATAAKPMLTAFVHFLFAERLRRKAFFVEPLGRYHVIDGHATRVFVRVCLWLAKRINENAATSLSIPHDHALRQSEDNWVFLTQQARRHIDILTRYFARYPAESASLLILEAAYVGVMSGKNATSRGPELAFNCLQKAQRHLILAPHRARVQLRHLLERTKVLRRLAWLSLERQDGNFQRYVNAAAYDAVRFSILARSYGFGFWSKLADRQRGKVEELWTNKKDGVKQLLKDRYPKLVDIGPEGQLKI